ncbi:hypothetical protein VSS74_10450 [Conexibacter stalactiti]|uniref:DUF4160 domain-containing protein n=1 Tax=Conexibacter stalactiti TaxID=1940611 RepID=A0ABU4HNA8_9ACTN|nr:hypothetical protein [Conexibacter stalactiti]MDW5594759.1 hypothetical protein [Conexibacter stalactiti]MEC5035401.1 hypothetical protein [Conexibacter stalactiti]
MAALISAVRNIFDSSTRPEPVHFHAGNSGHTVVCHDDSCSSPRLDLRDARELTGATGDLR